MKDQLHAIVISIGVVLGLCGMAWFYAAMSVEQYLGAIVLIGIAAAAIAAAYKLDPKGTDADLDALGKYLGPKAKGPKTGGPGDSNAI